MAKPRLLADLAREALDLERRRLRVGEQARLAHPDLELAGRQLRVDRLGVAADDRARRPLSTSSARSRWASSNASPDSSGWKTSWTSPVRSRRSTKTSPPWSRRRWTQPATRTSVSTRSASTWPHQVSRYSFARSAGKSAPLMRLSASDRARRGRAPAARRSACRGPRRAPSSSRITARRAPSRSACFIWPLSERPARSSSARRPAPRSSLDEREGALAPAPSGAATKTSARGSRLGLVEREQDPLDPGGPAAAGRRRAAERLDQAVVAPAAADRRRLRVEALGLELEHGARVVVEPADEGAVELVRRPRPGRAGCGPRRSARRPAGRGGRASAAPRPSPRASPGSLESKARSGFSSIRSRTSGASSPSWARR